VVGHCLLRLPESGKLDRIVQSLSTEGQPVLANSDLGAKCVWFICNTTSDG
jgi:hypothetical protein